nr:rod shape-determining protein MreD [uncultured Rhodopila sp.]
MAYIDRRPGIRPRPTLGRRLDIAARAGFPACITILLMLLTEAPLGMAGQATLLPAVALCSVWFWSLFRPESFPPPLVFLIGLLLDLLGYLPLGAGVFTLLCVHGVALALRRGLARRGFVWIWLVFALIASAASLAIWLLVMLLDFRLLSPRPAIFMAVLTMAIYPALAVPFAAAHRSVANLEDA